MAYTSTNIGARNITNGVTTVDCHKQVRSWRLLRSLMELLIPTCNCTFIEEEEEEGKKQDTKSKKSCQNNNKCSPLLMSSSSTTITGTIFGYRKGKVCFCIQSNKNSTNPILLLELAVPTSILAKEMRGGTLRIVLESSTNKSCNNNNLLFSTPLWTMYCNGRKVGYAVKRRPSNSDFEALSLMSFVEVGTGVINNGKELQEEDELMYLRANFQRVRGSSKSNNCESFHLIDPEGSIGQELSIFLFQSR